MKTDTRPFHDKKQWLSESTDESIVAFATVREQVMTSLPSFGDWKHRSDPTATTDYPSDIVPCMVEVTNGSPNKYEVDKSTGLLVLDRVLHSAVHYPGDYGYIPGTLCGDGDPLDLLIIDPDADPNSGLEPGVVANCRIVGIMDMEDESGRDEKIIAVLASKRSCSDIVSIDTIPPHLKREIQHFFETYKALEIKHGKPKWAKILGWGDKAKALQVLTESRTSYAEKQRAESHKPQRFQGLWSPNMLHATSSQTERNNTVLCYINVTKGKTNSYGYRHDTSFRHYRHTLDMPYPGDNGWICQTWHASSGKPLEVQVLTAFPLVAESLVEVRILGALQRKYVSPQGKKSVDFKIIAVPATDPRTAHLSTLNQINTAQLAHFEQFLAHSAIIRGCTDVEILPRLGLEEALELHKQTHQSYETTFTNKKIYNSPNLWCLPWGEELSGHVNDEKPLLSAVVENPKGSSNKYSFKKELGQLMLERPLYSATHWPGNYGFIPQTVAEDGQPVNVLILSNSPLKELSLCNVRIVGALKTTDEKGPDTKVIAVPKKEPRMKEWADVEQVPRHIKSEIENFFNSYKALEAEWRFCKVQAWIGKKETMEVCLSVLASGFWLGGRC